MNETKSSDEKFTPQAGVFFVDISVFVLIVKKTGGQMKDFKEYSKEEQLKIMHLVCMEMYAENEDLKHELEKANTFIQDYPRRRNILLLVAIFTFVCGFLLRMLT